jgi:hypothetical protein
VLNIVNGGIIGSTLYTVGKRKVKVVIKKESG